MFSLLLSVQSPKRWLIVGGPNLKVEDHKNEDKYFSESTAAIRVGLYFAGNCVGAKRESRKYQSVGTKGTTCGPPRDSRRHQGHKIG